MDDDSNWQRHLLVGVCMLLVVGALVGGVLAFAGIKVADLAGIGQTNTTTRSHDRLHVPRNAETPTKSAPTTPAPTSSSPSTAPPTRKPHKPHAPALTLAISPATASTYERINLTGTYAGHDGTSLQVQRQEGGTWVDFPTTATVSGGSFATYVETGHTGVNRFRVTDTSGGRSSKVATVTVR